MKCEDDEDDEPKMDMESVIEIDGVKYAPVVSEEDEMKKMKKKWKNLMILTLTKFLKN